MNQLGLLLSFYFGSILDLFSDEERTPTQTDHSPLALLCISQLEGEEEKVERLEGRSITNFAEQLERCARGSAASPRRCQRQRHWVGVLVDSKTDDFVTRCVPVQGGLVQHCL